MQTYNTSSKIFKANSCDVNAIHTIKRIRYDSRSKEYI